MSTQLLENLTKDTNNDKTERLKEKKKARNISEILDYHINPGLFNSRFVI